MREVELLREALERGAALRERQVGRGRYAPSPTGPLHMGNMRAALCAWLHAKLSGSTFVLRVEDIDEQRSQGRFIAQLVEDLRWLGIDFDEGPEQGGPCEPYVQSQRTALYEGAFALLREQGRVYPCHCSRREIREAASAPDPGKELVYPGTCRGREAAREGEAAWRFVPAARALGVEDGVKGRIVQQLDEEVGDFVIKRRDGLFAYQLAVVVDDLAMGMTDVVRGEDLFDSTPRQVELIEALGGEAPRYWHVPLMVDEQGEKLSKRTEACAMGALREQGWRAEQVVGELGAGLGWVEQGASLSVQELLSEVGSLSRWAEAMRHPRT